GRGFQAVAVDLPAHGRSSGKEASLPAFVQAILDLSRDVGPFKAVIAHSLGAAATGFVATEQDLAGRLVLIAPAAEARCLSRPAAFTRARHEPADRASTRTCARRVRSRPARRARRRPAAGAARRRRSRGAARTRPDGRGAEPAGEARGGPRSRPPADPPSAGDRRARRRLRAEQRRLRKRPARCRARVGYSQSGTDAPCRAAFAWKASETNAASPSRCFSKNSVK